MAGGLFVVTVITTIVYAPYLGRVFGLSESMTAMYILFPAAVLAVAAAGLYFTWRNWLRDREPMWRQIRLILQELDALETNAS
jgi:hypothetical protein